ncbi:hypothetical protein CY34DRAFT_133891 [Suillus luteus UH-Slu-Lm8-n1]|uniref:Uncharacterized protein n=1 Tax=Suillus luteus UH-Slu-Lm8-n1 TaxID=930992 RepID=A0A0C9ZY20_9AGAM|nr:hypothetical protein CY34DRAFT_133891 [Suillus luteus UH-Slu-Lm8-n1]
MHQTRFGYMPFLLSIPQYSLSCLLSVLQRMSVFNLCPSWTENRKNQTPCAVAREVDNECLYSYAVMSPPSSEQAFIPSGSNVTACTCSWASYNLFSACMFCASSSPSLVSWDDWTANCPTNLMSTTTYFPSNAGVTLPSNTSIPCYAGYNRTSKNH